LRSQKWNKYCRADNFENNVMQCNQNSAGSAESFKMELNGGSGPLYDGDTVALRSVAWSKYCAAEEVDEHVVHCDRDTVGAWEEYIVKKFGDGEPVVDGDTIALRSVYWKKYCASEEYGSHPVRCNRDSAGPWEQYKIEKK